MIDSHCHLSHSPLSENIETTLEEFIKLGGKNILDTSYNVDSLYAVLKIKRKYDSRYPGVILSALGIHPEVFIETSDLACQNGLDINKARKYIDTTESVIKDNITLVDFIGETGLDYHLFFDPDIHTNKDVETAIEIQKMSFRKHLELAVSYKKPLTIHSRDLTDRDECVTDTLKMICEVGKGKICAVMHSYTGSIKYVQDIVDLGLYIGFNAIITYKNAENVRNICKQTPLDKILLETDAPFLPLRNTHTQHSSPADVLQIARTIAEVKGTSTSEVLKGTDSNFGKLVNANH